MRILIAALMLSLAGCASLNSVSVTSVPAKRDQTVSAQASRWIIFGFNFDNDYADAVAKDLSRKCPSGKISGILTKDEAYFYFLFFVVKRQVTATGYCDAKTVASARTSNKSRRVNSVEEGAAPAEAAEEDNLQ